MTGHKHGTGGSNSLLSSAKSKENYNTLGGFINESFLNENTKDHQDSKLIFEKPRTRTSIISIKGPQPSPKPSLPTSVLSIWFLIISPTFWKFVWKAFSKGLNVDDLWHVGEPNNAGVICERFEALWNDEVKKKGLDKASFIVVAAKYILPQLIIALLGVVIMGACNFVVGVVFLPLLIENMSSTNKEFAVLMVLAILLVDFLRSTLFLYVLNTGAMIGKRVQGAIMNLALKKTLRSRKMGDAISAKIVNLCATDVYLLYNATRFLCFIFLVIVQSVLTIVYTIVVLDVWALVGCALIILYTPLQVCFGQMSAKFTKQAMSFMDKRVSMVSSVLNSIKIIKMYAWENIFKNTILDLRTQELRKFFIKTFFDALNLVITPVIPIIAYSVSIICYAMFKEMPKPSLVFSIVVVFNNLNGMVYFLSYAQRYIFDSLIAVKRIKQFFLIEEVEPMEMLSYGTSAVEFKNATLGFDIQDLNIKKRKKKNRRKGKMDTQLNIIGKYVATINDLTMNVKKGSLIGICGSIGSGKSSLLSGILGEAKILQGTIKVTGSIAYVPQEAWIIAGTLRENILLGSDYDEKRYQEAILVSCLKPDIDMLDNGDLTEIRERGINLSGGQRQRVSMARAIYNTSDVYLLDDPLSALDSKVGRYIFNYAIQGYLKSKTVLLVTHQLQYLKECEQILFLKNGRIFESGSHSDLMALNGEYAGLIIKHIGHEDEEKSKDLSPSSLENSLEDLLSSILEEETAHKASVEPEVNGVITFSRIFDYFRAGGICLFLTFILSLTLHQGCATFANSWLGEWLKKYPNGTKSTILVDDSYEDTNTSLYMMDTDYNDNNSYYNTEAGPISNITTFLSESLNVSNITNLLPYGISEGNISNLIPDLSSFKNISNVLTKSFFNNVSDLLTEADSSTNISDALTEEVPYNIFDHLPKDTDFYFTILGAGIGGVLVFGFTTMYIFATLTTSASRNLHKRLLDKVIRSPMSFFDSTETGQILSRFTRDMLEVDLSISFCSTVTCTRIFSVLGTLCQAGVTQPFTVIIFGGFIVVVFFLNKVCFGAVVQTKQLENTVRAQIIGHMTTISQGLSSIRAFKREKLFIDKCHTLTNNDCVSGLLLYLTLNWGSWVLQSSFLIIFVIVGLVFVLTGADETESGVVLSAMLQNILMLDVIIFCLMEIEARLTNVQRIKYYIKTLTTEGDEYLPTEGLAETELFPNGRVIFDDVQMRYKPKSPLVLNGITFEVYPGEKVGIVGRTGAGKSSIGSVLFRLVELCGGKIIIDGIDIKDLALYDLRSKLSIIPQEPVLFPGTLRYNLDPLDEYDDFTLWQALERSHLKSRIQAEEKQLDTFVDSQGDNFSVGERQLICLARALLRNSKVLFLDEATASVDTETDSLIQETIKSEFKTCTVLSIAHRLNTVMNCDRILVLNFGEVLEFDSPANLLSDPDSSFRSMALEAGLLTSSLTKL